MRISLVVAVSENGVIGRAGALPWHLPDDSRRFRLLTTGHHVIMGRRTFESIGRPLPERVNVVLTRSGRLSAEGGVLVVGDLAEALAVARSRGEAEAFVIGGTSVYAAALPLADAIHLTRVHADLAGDAYFPDLAADAWSEVQREHHPGDARHAHAFTYTLLERAHPRTEG